ERHRGQKGVGVAGRTGKGKEADPGERRNKKNHKKYEGFGLPPAEPARRQRADDVEQADERDGPPADIVGKALVHQIGWHVYRNEGQLEATGKKAEHEKQIGAVRKRFSKRVPERW